MKLSELIFDLPIENQGAGDPEITDLTNDTRRLVPGALFAAMEGTKENGSDYIREALEKGAKPVLLTPVARRFFSEPNSLMYTHGEYPLAVRKLAAEKGVALCDLNRDSRRLYLSLGPERAAELFVRLAPGEHPDFPDGHDDRTHFCAQGARTVAGLVAEELRGIPDCAAYILEQQ